MNIGTLTGAIAIEDQASNVMVSIIAKAAKFKDELTGSMGLAALAIGAVGTAAIGAAVSITKLAEKGSTLNDIREAFDRVAESAGSSGKAIREALSEGVKGTIDDTKLMTSTVRLLQSGMKLSTDQAKLMGEASRALGKATGGDAAAGLSILSNALLTGRTRSLQMQIGVIDLKKGQDEFAKSIGTTRDKLNELGQLEGKRIAILQATQAYLDRVGVAELSFKERLQQTRVQIGQWVDDLASAVAASPKVVAAYDAMKQAILDAMGGSAEKAHETIVAWVNRFADAVREWGPYIIDKLVQIKDRVVDLWHRVQEAWNLVPDWFKNIAKEAATAAVVVGGVNLAFKGFTGMNFVSVLGAAASAWSAWGKNIINAGAAVGSFAREWGQMLIVFKWEAVTLGIKTLGASLLALAATPAGITTLFVALGAALVQVGKAIGDLYEWWKAGKPMWDFFTARDTDNWVRRWLGFETGAGDAKRAIDDLNTSISTYNSVSSQEPTGTVDSMKSYVTNADAAREALEDQKKAISEMRTQAEEDLPATSNLFLDLVAIIKDEAILGFRALRDDVLRILPDLRAAVDRDIAGIGKTITWLKTHTQRETADISTLFGGLSISVAAYSSQIKQSILAGFLLTPAQYNAITGQFSSLMSWIGGKYQTAKSWVSGLRAAEDLAVSPPKPPATPSSIRPSAIQMPRSIWTPTIEDVGKYRSFTAALQTGEIQFNKTATAAGKGRSENDKYIDGAAKGAKSVKDQADALREWQERITSSVEKLMAIDKIQAAQDAVEAYNQAVANGVDAEHMSKDAVAALNKTIFDGATAMKSLKREVPEAWHTIEQATTFATQKGVEDITELWQWLSRLEKIYLDLSLLIPKIKFSIGVPSELPGTPVGPLEIPGQVTGPRTFDYYTRDWDALRRYSKDAMQYVAERAQDAYETARKDSKNFSKAAVQDLKEIADRAWAAAGDVSKAFKVAWYDIRDSFRTLPDLFMQAFTGGGGVAGALKAFATQTYKDFVNPLLDYMGKIKAGAVGVGAGISTLLGGMFGGKTGATIGNIAGTLGGAVLGATTALGTAALGAATMGIGAAAAGIGSLVKKFLSTAGRDLKRQLAVDMFGSEKEMQRQLVMLGQETYDRLWKQYSDVGQGNKKQAEAAMTAIAEAIGALNADIERYQLSLWDLADAQKVSTDTAKALEASYKRLTAAGYSADKVTEAMSADLSEYVTHAVTAGTKIPAAMQPILEKLIRMGKLSDEAKRALLGLTDSAMPALADIKEAADRYGLSLDKLGPKVQQLSITEQASQIAKDFELLTSAGADFSQLMEPISAAEQAVIDLNKKGYDTAAIGSAEWDEYRHAVERWKDAVDEGGSAAEGMRAQIQHLVNKAMDAGLELPASMEPIIQKMIEAGMLTDNLGEKLTDTSKLHFAADLTGMFETLIDKLDEFIEKLANETVGALTDVGKVKIPPIKIPTEVVWPDYGNVPEGVPEPPHTPAHAATGGYVTESGVIAFRPSGTDTVPAMLTPGETIFPAGSMPAARGGGTVRINIGPRFLAEIVVPEIPGVVQEYGLG